MYFDHLAEASPDPILGMKQAFLADTRPHKVDLGVGIYKTAELKEPVMAAVKEAETRLFSREIIGDYLPIDGDPAFIQETGKLSLGPFYETNAPRIYGAQSVGGTGGLRVCAEFLAQLGVKEIYLPDPTWPNHLFIFEKAKIAIRRYPYYSKEKKGLDFDAMHAFFSGLEERSAILFHACCHNPTGSDPTLEEWKTLSSLFKRKKLFTVFDMAYQGLGQGLDADAAGVRHFAEAGHSICLVLTFAKNFSLYAQRAASFFLVLEEEKQKKIVASHVKRIIRPLYSNPPAHGALIVAEILRAGELRKKWLHELEGMRKRITQMRNALTDLLVAKPSPVNYEFLRNHKGMFSFCNLEKTQVARLREEYAIHMSENGRINIAGLNQNNIEYVANALHAVSLR